MEYNQGESSKAMCFLRASALDGHSKFQSHLTEMRERHNFQLAEGTECEESNTGSVDSEISKKLNK